MEAPKTKFKTVDEYIGSFPEDVQRKLETIRKTIKKAAPKANEVVAYGMAGYKLNGPLIYFAAFKKHIGIYPGTLKIALDEPVPTKLVSDMVKQQLKRITKKSTTTKSKRK